jgi:hypothetical protein
MDSNAIHDYARRFVGAHGDKAELEAAQRAAECERQGQKDQAGDCAEFRPRSRRYAARTRADRMRRPLSRREWRAVVRAGARGKPAPCIA